MRYVLITLVLIEMIFSFFLGFLGGWAYGTDQIYMNRFYEEGEALAPILEDPALLRRGLSLWQSTTMFRMHFLL